MIDLWKVRTSWISRKGGVWPPLPTMIHCLELHNLKPHLRIFLYSIFVYLVWIRLFSYDWIVLHFIWVVISPVINGLTNSTAQNGVWLVKRMCFLSPLTMIFSSILFLMIIASSTWRKCSKCITVFWIVICVIFVTFTTISFVCIKKLVQI